MHKISVCWKQGVVIWLLLLGGCTTSIRSVPLTQYIADKPEMASDEQSSSGNTGEIPRGVVYRLPMTALDYEAKYRLDSCSVGTSTERSAHSLYRITLLDAKVTPVTVADTDPRSTFVVNPEDMTNWFKQVKEAQLELHGGLLRKVAYEAEDRSRQIVEQATKIALRFGTISTPGAPGLVARGKVTEIGCNGVAVAALKRATELKGKVIIGKGRVAAAALEFKKDPTPAKGVKLEQEKTSLAKYEVELAAVIEKQLSHVTRERLYPRSSKHILEKDIAYEHSPEIPTELVTQWLDVIVGDTASVSRAKAQLQREIGVKILVNGAFNTNSDYIGAFDGIYYRSPVEMKLLAQRASVQESPLAVGSVPFFQFGVLAAIPISNGVFQNNRFVVQFTEDGKLKSFEYKEPKARAEEALATVEDNLGILEDSEKAAIEAETNLLKAEKERVDAEKALLEAQGELNNVRDGI